MAAVAVGVGIGFTICGAVAVEGRWRRGVIVFD